MYVDNRHKYGHLLNADNYETSRLHNDMYSIFDNRLVSGRCSCCYVCWISMLCRTGKDVTCIQTGLKCLKIMLM